MKIHACRESMPQKREIEKLQTWQSAWPWGHKLQPSLPKKVQLKWRGVKKKQEWKKTASICCCLLSFCPWLYELAKPERFKLTRAHFTRTALQKSCWWVRPPTSKHLTHHELISIWNCEMSDMQKLLLIGRQRLWRRSN